MAAITRTALVSGATVLSAAWDADFDALLGVLNGGIENEDIKIGADISGDKFADRSILGSHFSGTNVTVLEAKLNYEDFRACRVQSILGANGTRVAIGVDTWSIVAGSLDSGTVLFSAATFGNPVFTTAPRVVCEFINTTSTVTKYGFDVHSVITTEFQWRMKTSGVTTNSGTFLWIAVGAF